MTHAITLKQAKEMTARYRKEKENILASEFKGKDILSLSETFEAGSFRALLDKPGCQSLRIYFGMNDKLQVRIIAVAVSEKGEILEGENSIMEEGTVCPPVCPPPPPPDSLNE